jgi:L-ascorbate metabolism protein UlaG (beta-lactamase superfamily)
MLAKTRKSAPSFSMIHRKLFRSWSFRSVFAVSSAVILMFGAARNNLGQRPSDTRKAEIEGRSRVEGGSVYQDGKFRNTLPNVEPPFFSTLARWFKGVPDSQPKNVEIPVDTEVGQRILTPPAQGLRVTWFGHSSLYLEIDGVRILTDPVWGERCAPWSFMGPKRFFAPPLPLSALPELDAVVISHDHYDHLDTPSIIELAAKVPRFIVPLGVGSHLQYWGVSADKITELDWWQETVVKDLKITATPARHFSGRFLSDRDATLWAGWSFSNAKHRLFFSGDSAMFPGFAEIGERLGPFDLTMIEVGAYDQAWADVHLGPEQAIAAHQALRGRVLLPVHWGTFDLALHSWVEPIERLLVAAKEANVSLAVPRPGGSVLPSSPTIDRWWPEVAWRTAKEYPVVSSRL